MSDPCIDLGTNMIIVKAIPQASKKKTAILGQKSLQSNLPRFRVQRNEHHLFDQTKTFLGRKAILFISDFQEEIITRLVKSLGQKSSHRFRVQQSEHHLFDQTTSFRQLKAGRPAILYIPINTYIYLYFSSDLKNPIFGGNFGQKTYIYLYFSTCHPIFHHFSFFYVI